MKVAIYCRVSSEMQSEDEIPILGQIEECQAYAKSKNWEVIKIYKDEGFTGRNTERPGFQQMIADAHQNPIPFQKVIVWKGSRIARNVENRLACQSLLAKRGIDIVSVKEPEFEGSIRVLMLPIMAAIDEYQSYIIGEDTLRGMKTLARQGYSPGGKPPKGYRIRREPVGIKKNGEPRFRSTWEPDPEWRDKASKAFQMVAEGRSSEDIIKETGVVKDRSGLPTYFRNPTFVGERVFNVHRRKNGRVALSPRQRCVVHRIRNVLARVPKKRQDAVKKSLHRIFYAACLDDARDEAKQFLSRYSREFPTACETLARHLEECLTFYRFPERHWKHIRTSNVIERAFKEVKRRTRVVGRFPNETSALVSSLINRINHLAAFARICSAVFVHTKGLAPSFHRLRKAFIASTRWATLLKLPLRIAWLVSMPNQISTIFIQEAPVGVK
jgi:Site-specific recombinases, DNA invertase Pin homologs